MGAGESRYQAIQATVQCGARDCNRRSPDSTIAAIRPAAFGFICQALRSECRACILTITMARPPRSLSTIALDALKKVRSALAPFDECKRQCLSATQLLRWEERRLPFWTYMRAGIAYGCSSTPSSDQSGFQCEVGFRLRTIQRRRLFAAGWMPWTGGAPKRSCAEAINWLACRRAGASPGNEPRQASIYGNYRREVFELTNGE